MPIPITGLFVPSGGADAFNLVNWHDVAHHKWDGTDPPTPNNDVNDGPEGYVVGSLWCDVTHDKAYVCLDNTDGAAVWIEITGAGGGLGAIDFAVDGMPFCSGTGIDLQAGAGVWISGTCSGGEAEYDIGAYPAPAAPTSISGVDFELNDGLVGWGHIVDMKEGLGVWISGAFVGGRTEYEFGAYPEPPPPTSTSGVDWSAKDSFLGFGSAADFREGYGVWISGSFVAGEALYYIGRYDQAIPASISGVDIKLENGLICFGRGLDFHQGAGVWISGTCAGQEVEITFGAYPSTVDAANVTYMPAASGTDWDQGVDPGNIGPAVDQLAQRIRNGKLVFESYEMWPSTGTGALTDGCAWPARRELETNGKNIFFMAFDSATDEAGESSGDLEVWDGGTVTVTIHWTTVAAAGTTVCWSVSLGATGDDGALDAAFGSAVAVTDTVLASGDLHVCTTAAITVANAGAGKHLQIRIMRDVSEDTCASDADLIRVIVHYNRRAA